jgi:hypothetical protein
VDVQCTTPVTHIYVYRTEIEDLSLVSHQPLPFETWRHIFRHLPSESLTQLLLVSRAWRDVANGTPELWNSIVIRHTHQFTNPAGLSYSLNKSGRCLLNVFITVPVNVALPDLVPTGTLRLLYHHVVDVD